MNENDSPSPDTPEHISVIQANKAVTKDLNGPKGPKGPKGPAKNASSSKSPRRRAREFALQGLYQWRIGGADEAAIEAHAHDIAGFEKADGNFFCDLLRGVIKQQYVLHTALEPYLDRTMNELSPIEACVLLIGAYELQTHPETPYRVIINEAIELTKTYGGTDGHKYVNGVLDKLAAKLRPAEVAARASARQNVR